MSNSVDGHGRVSNYVLSHNALSFTKKSFKEVKKQWRKQIENTIQQSFRSPKDVTLGLFRDYQLETGNFSVRSPKFSKYFVLNEADAIAKELQDQKHSLLCINDAGTKNYEHNVKIVQQGLEQSFSSKSSFEK